MEQFLKRCKQVPIFYNLEHLCWTLFSLPN